MSHYARVKEYISELGYGIEREVPEEELIVISDENSGISHLIIDCEGEIVILEQFLFELPAPEPSVLTRLLQLNRELVHGALALDESATRVIFRDTLELENLDLNELDASIKALSLMLAENANELIRFAKGN